MNRIRRMLPWLFDGCFSVPEDWSQRFAITGLAPGRVEVAIGLPGLGPCRTALTEVKLTLVRPAALNDALLVVPPSRPPLLLRHGTPA